MTLNQNMIKIQQNYRIILVEELNLNLKEGRAVCFDFDGVIQYSKRLARWKHL